MKEVKKTTLEEAAMAQANPVLFGGKIVDYLESKYEAFIAGAEWQAEQMPMPEDTVLFQKGVEEGKRLMMEDAVECELYRDGDFFASIDIDIATLGYTEKDKVKIIIVKEEDEK